MVLAFTKHFLHGLNFNYNFTITPAKEYDLIVSYNASVDVLRFNCPLMINKSLSKTRPVISMDNRNFKSLAIEFENTFHITETSVQKHTKISKVRYSGNFVVASAY